MEAVYKRSNGVATARSVLLAACSLVFCLTAMAQREHGLRTQQGIVEHAPNIRSTIDVQRHLRDDIDYVKRHFVDQPRYYQGWGRVMVQSFRAFDMVPIVGGLGLGGDFVKWQEEIRDNQIAMWLRHGLEELDRDGKFSSATPEQLARVLVDGKFKGEPQVVREEMFRFLALQQATDLTDLRRKIDKVSGGLSNTRRLKSAAMRDLVLQTTDLRRRQTQVERSLRELTRRVSPTQRELLAQVFSTIDSNAKAIASLFPGNHELQRASLFASRAAQFAQTATLATGPGGAAHVLPALASGMALLRRSRGQSESEAVLAALRRLEAVINAQFRVVNEKLDTLSEQLVKITALQKEVLLIDVWQCGSILQKQHGGGLLLENELYRLEFGVALPSGSELRKAFPKADLRLRQCKDGLVRIFGNLTDLKVFQLTENEEQLKPEEMNAAEQKQFREYFSTLTRDTLSGMEPLVGPRSLIALQQRAPVLVADVEAKMRVIAQLQLPKAAGGAPLLSKSELLSGLNPGLVAKASGYGLALHNTLTLTSGNKYAPGSLASEVAAAAVVEGIQKAVVRTASQQRLLAGDVLLPIINEIYKNEKLGDSTMARFRRFVAEGWLPEDFPVESNEISARRYQEIRNRVLLALGSNAQLRRNLLVFDLASDLPDLPTQQVIQVAMKARAFGALPPRWLGEHRVRWRSIETKDGVSEGWVGDMRVVRRMEGGNEVAAPLEVPLAPETELLEGVLAVGHATRYLEDLEAFARRERASYVYATAAANNASLSAVVKRLLQGGMDPVAFVD